MIVVSCRITLAVPEARSLKDKRSVVRSLLHRLREAHNVSAVELEGRDAWQSAVLGVALAARDRAEADARLERVRREAERTTGLKRVDFETEYY